MVVAVSVLTAACGSDGKKSTANGQTTPTASAATAAIVTAAEKSVADHQQFPAKILAAGAFTPTKTAVIYNVACDQSLVGCSVIAKGIKSGVEALGYEYRLCDAGKTPQQASGCFSQAVNGKAAAIITNAVGTNVAGDGYAAAGAAKIPVAAIFSGNAPGAPGVVAEVGADACAGQGANIADYVIANSKGKANVLLLTERSIACNIQRTDGFTAEINKCPDCTSKLLQFDIATMQTNLPRQVLAEIQANPNLNYVVGVFGAASQVGATSVQQSARPGISVAGLDSDPAILQLMKDGDIVKGSVAFGRGEAGWTAVDAIARLLAGQTPAASLPVQQLLITDANVANLPTGGFDGATDYQTQFKALWGKS
jgi:ribose transport system substrate-binding protein